ncbi:TPA: transcriptional regulator [Serratia fonticola]
MIKQYIINNKVIFNLEKHSLTTQGKDPSEIVLHIPASNCLQLLLEHSGETLSQKFLFEHAWENKGINATPNALYQNIAQIRKGLKALGLSKNTIRTLPRAGFKLSADVKVVTDVYADVMTTPLVQRVEPADTTNATKINEKVYSLESKLHELDVSLEHQANMQHSIEKTTLPPDKKKYHLKQYWWAMLIFGLLTFLNYQFSHTKIATEKYYFKNYYKIGKIINCELHSSYYGKRESIDKLIAFTKNIDLTCPAEGHIYITINRVEKIDTAIVCNMPIDIKNAHCDNYVNIGD